MAPFDLTEVGKVGTAVITVGLGFGFGFALERAGFGDSRRLAAQFYLHEMRVLKVMFTAIVTAMMLVFWSSAFGLLDYQAVFVNPTYIWSGIIGGFVLGMGFIVGGFCPGTSLVAISTFKLDGLVFFVGCLVGVFIFGESVPAFRTWWEQNGAVGRLTLPDWLGLSTGLVVVLVALMAVFMFWGAEKLEVIFTRRREGGAS